MMRFIDHYRLARLSLTSKKKTTIQSIVGISFALILLFPVLFIMTGFYSGFTKQLNSEPYLRSQRVMFASTKTYYGNVLCDEAFEEDINSIKGIKNVLKYDHFYLKNMISSPFNFSLDGGERIAFNKPKEIRSRDKFIGVEVIDEKSANKPFIDADKRLSSRPLVAGKVFTKNNSKGEIMVSSKFVYDFKLDAKSLVGSTISLYGTISKSLNSYSNSMDELISPNEYKQNVEITYFENFKIVGVYNSGNIYYSRSPRYNSLKFNLDGVTSSVSKSKDYFWISSASLGDNGETIAPKRVIKEDTNIRTWYYYEDSPKNLSERITSEGYAFFPIGLGTFTIAGHYPSYTKTEILDFNSVEAARDAFDEITSFLRQSVTGDPDHPSYKYPVDVISKSFFVYEDFYNRFLYVCLGLAILGGVIFIATLLNLINTLHFSIESMRGFLGICKAEGMRKKSVIHIFLAQLNLIFAVSYIATIIVGTSICIFIKNYFDSTIKNEISTETGLTLSIDSFYIPLSLIALLAFTTIISIGISFFLVKKINDTPALEILTEENRM